jgi:hypothetical protein
MAFVQELVMRYPDVSKRMKLNHVIKTLTFGEPTAHAHIKKRFGANNEHTAFDMMDFVDDELYKSDDSSKDYFYFLKLVPHVFVDEIYMETYSSYSYSLNHNSKV